MLFLRLLLLSRNPALPKLLSGKPNQLPFIVLLPLHLKDGSLLHRRSNVWSKKRRCSPHERPVIQIWFGKLEEPHSPARKVWRDLISRQEKLLSRMYSGEKA
tara:strand:+ start:258 stop:563 length:306 start_codon:yes stop_codon:yes gene_type:complete